MNKKLKPGNIIMDCIIGGVILVFLIVIGTIVMDRKNNSSESEKVTPAPVKKEAGVEKYRCIIENGSKNDTVFGLDFDSADMTYKEYLEAGETSSTLDEGTYEVKDGKWITKSTKEKPSASYIKDGEVLLAEGAFYQGELPEGDNFNAVFVYEKKGELKNTLTFQLDGTYDEEIVSYGVKEGDSTKTTHGTYERKGNTIARVTDAGEKLLDFYIYNDRITNAYYKLEK